MSNCLCRDAWHACFAIGEPKCRECACTFGMRVQVQNARACSYVCAHHGCVYSCNMCAQVPYAEAGPELHGNGAPWQTAAGNRGSWANGPNKQMSKADGWRDRRGDCWAAWKLRKHWCLAPPCCGGAEPSIHLKDNPGQISTSGQ